VSRVSAARASPRWFMDVLYKALAVKRVGAASRNSASGWKAIRMSGKWSLWTVADRRTPRSNPATYLKAFDAIRDVFAETPDAKRRAMPPVIFRFNVPGGRCETCQGDGTVTVEMQFLADVELICEECRGTRFKSGVLEVRYHGKNVHEVLQLTVREALAFFVNVPRLFPSSES